MKIAFESELMKNQKHAEVMAPDLKFDVLQTDDGCSLFFSIGTDGVFYLTQETTGTKTGWNKLDLSSGLSSQHNGAKVTAKTFDVAQNAQTGAIDLMLAITVNGSDFLYLSRGNSNTDMSWAAGVNWTYIPFDDANNPMPMLGIADVYVLQVPPPSSSESGEYFVVDILKEPGNPLNLICRYYITPSTTPSAKQWNPHSLPVDFSAGTVTSAVGQRPGGYTAGVYTFGKITSEQELIYTPLYNAFKPGNAPTPSPLPLPDMASAIAPAANSAGFTNLFVAGNSALYLFTPDNQHGQKPAVQIVSNSVFAGVQSLYAASGTAKTAVWGINQQGDLFYVQCNAGSEADPKAWSFPVPILTNVEQFAFFLNAKKNNNVIFAHTQGQNLVQLTQDPVTTQWQQRSILLPSTDPNDVIEYDSYTTHIKATDDNNIPAANIAFLITSLNGPVSVYLNDVYHVLSPDVPVQASTNVTGALTVVQEAHGLGGVSYHVQLQATGEAADINPMSNAVSTLSSIQTGDDLAKVKVSNTFGKNQTQVPLLPADATKDQRGAAASSLQQLVTVSNTLPQNGAVKSSSSSSATSGMRALRAAAPVPLSQQVWGISFARGGWSYHEGQDAIQHFGLQQVASPTAALKLDTGVGDLANAIEVAAGDFFNWLKSVFESVTQALVQLVGDVYHFFIQIGEAFYHAVLDCIHAIVSAAEFIFNQLKVFFEDLIKWLGFIFGWDDILRTHSVIKNFFNRYIEYSIGNLSTYEKQLTQLSTTLQGQINTWAGLPQPSQTLASQTSLGTVPGQNHPGANWGTHHLNSNAGSASTSYTPGNPDVSSLEQVFTDVLNAIKTEGQDIGNACQEIKTQIIDQISTLSLGDIIKRLFGIIADLVVETMTNLVVTTIEILETVIKAVSDVLNATLDIPVISWIYKLITGDDLSFMDLACLVMAIPTTIIYKIVSGGNAPFPDDSETSQLIAAPDFATIQSIFSSSETALASRPRMLTSSPFGLPSLDTPTERWAFAANIIAWAAGIGVALVTALKDSLGDLPVLGTVFAVCYIPYCAPDFYSPPDPGKTAQTWDQIMNEAVTGVSIVKTIIDGSLCGLPTVTEFQKFWYPASPWIGAGISLAWMVPAAWIVSHGLSIQSIVSTVANVSFNMTDIIGIWSITDPEPVSKAILLAVVVGTIALYGDGTLISSFLSNAPLHTLEAAPELQPVSA